MHYLIQIITVYFIFSSIFATFPSFKVCLIFFLMKVCSFPFYSSVFQLLLSFLPTCYYYFLICINRSINQQNCFPFRKFFFISPNVFIPYEFSPIKGLQTESSNLKMKNNELQGRHFLNF